MFFLLKPTVILQSEQGLIQVLLVAFICIGVPGLVLYIFLGVSPELTKYLNQIITDATSSVVTTIVFIAMIAAPILAFLIFIIATIYDYFTFKLNPNAIKALSVNQEYIIVYYNNSQLNKKLSLDEIDFVQFKSKYFNSTNPRNINSGYKIGGYSLATAAGVTSSQKYN